MNKIKTLFFIFLVIFINFNTAIFAQNRQITAFPRLESDPNANNFFNIYKTFTWAELAQISLWASGDTNFVNLEKINTAVRTLNNSLELPPAGREKAEFILQYLHTILRTYSLYQTRVDTVFTNGVYNCVSSAVLYMILCESAGIRTSAVITKEHAFIMVHIDGQNIDVETTNRYGFDPGNRKEFHDHFGRLTGFSYVPAQNYRDRQTINHLELISLILNNRIADFERRNNYFDAVPLAIDRAVLLLGESMSVINEYYFTDLFKDPRKDLIDRLINYGATLLRANREEDGLRWAIAASSKYRNDNRWQEFILASINNRITRYIRERKIDDARVFLESNRNLLTNANLLQLDTVVTDSELLNRANQSTTAAEGDAVINDIFAAQNSGIMSERRASELLTLAIQRTAASLCASPGRNWRAAIIYLEASLVKIGANRVIEQALQTYRSNLAAEYHNRFAAEWNKRNFDEAERILNEALQEFPTNRQLPANRDIVNRHHAQ